MLTKLTQLALAIICLTALLSCDPTAYVTQKHFFTDEYTIMQVTAPAYPFKGEKKQNPISIQFPKQGIFSLNLSENNCSGEYEANTDGTISFARTNCTPQCCDSDWDLYILTLIKKATKFEEGHRKSLILYINDNNYLVLESNLNAIQSMTSSSNSYPVI